MGGDSSPSILSVGMTREQAKKRKSNMNFAALDKYNARMREMRRKNSPHGDSYVARAANVLSSTTLVPMHSVASTIVGKSKESLGFDPSMGLISNNTPASRDQSHREVEAQASRGPRHQGGSNNSNSSGSPNTSPAVSRFDREDDRGPRGRPGDATNRSSSAHLQTRDILHDPETRGRSRSSNKSREQEDLPSGGSVIESSSRSASKDATSSHGSPGPTRRSSKSNSYARKIGTRTASNSFLLSSSEFSPGGAASEGENNARHKEVLAEKLRSQQTYQRIKLGVETRQETVFREADALRKSMRGLHSVINPDDSRIALYIQVSAALCMIFVCFLTPYESALLAVDFNSSLFWVNRLIDVVFLADMILHFFLMYRVPTLSGGSVLVTSGRKIAGNYLRTWFVIDFLAVFPFWIFEPLGYSSIASGGGGAALLRCLRLLRLGKLMKSMRFLREKAIHYTITHAASTLLQFFVVLILSAHWLACVWAAVGVRSGGQFFFNAALEYVDGGSGYFSPLGTDMLITTGSGSERALQELEDMVQDVAAQESNPVESTKGTTSAPASDITHSASASSTTASRMLSAAESAVLEDSGFLESEEIGTSPLWRMSNPSGVQDWGSWPLVGDSVLYWSASAGTESSLLGRLLSYSPAGDEGKKNVDGDPVFFNAAGDLVLDDSTSTAGSETSTPTSTGERSRDFKMAAEAPVTVRENLRARIVHSLDQASYTRRTGTTSGAAGGPPQHRRPHRTSAPRRLGLPQNAAAFVGSSSAASSPLNHVLPRQGRRRVSWVQVYCDCTVCASPMGCRQCDRCVASPWQVYVGALHYSLMTLTSIGYGDVVATHTFERFVSCGIMFVAGVTWASIVGFACGLISYRTAKNRKTIETIDDLNRMMRERDVDPQMRHRLRHFFYMHRDLGETKQNYEHLLQRMSPTLKAEVAFSVHAVYMLRVTFLSNADRDFLAAICLALKPEAYAQGEPMGDAQVLYVMRAGVAMLNGCVFRVGGYWGEDVLLDNPELTVFYSGFAMTYVEASSISRKQLNDVLLKFPEQSLRIRRHKVSLAVQRTLMRAAQETKMRLAASGWVFQHEDGIGIASSSAFFSFELSRRPEQESLRQFANAKKAVEERSEQCTKLVVEGMLEVVKANMITDVQDFVDQTLDAAGEERWEGEGAALAGEDSVIEELETELFDDSYREDEAEDEFGLESLDEGGRLGLGPSAGFEQNSLTRRAGGAGGNVNLQQQNDALLVRELQRELRTQAQPQQKIPNYGGAAGATAYRRSASFFQSTSSAPAGGAGSPGTASGVSVVLTPEDNLRTRSSDADLHRLVERSQVMLENRERAAAGGSSRRAAPRAPARG